MAGAFTVMRPPDQPSQRKVLPTGFRSRCSVKIPASIKRSGSEPLLDGRRSSRSEVTPWRACWLNQRNRKGSGGSVPSVISGNAGTVDMLNHTLQTKTAPAHRYARCYSCGGRSAQDELRLA